MTGQALYAPEEGRLHDLLESSKSFQDFVDNLKKAGYKVVPAKD